MKHYFVSFVSFNRLSNEWIYAQGVINRHPFEFIKDQGAPLFAILTNFKEITEEEYVLYDQLFKQ